MCALCSQEVSKKQKTEEKTQTLTNCFQRETREVLKNRPPEETGAARTPQKRVRGLPKLGKL